MTELIIQSLLTALTVAVVINSTPYKWLTQRLPDEPFRCCLCAGFWVGVYWAAATDHGFLDTVWAGSVVSFTAELVDRKLNQ
jgi:hypothetical protein